jgi:hypothetical protein
MTGLAFLATFCCSVGIATAVIHLILRRVRPNGSRTALAVGVGLFTPILLVIFGTIVLWSANSEPLEAAIHIWALAGIAALVGLTTTAIIAAFKV